MKVTIQGCIFRIWFEHQPDAVHEHGRGITQAKISFDDGSAMVTASALCSDKEPGYSRARGRKVALSKALKLYGFSQEERKQIWQQLFEPPIGVAAKGKGMKP